MSRPFLCLPPNLSPNKTPYSHLVQCGGVMHKTMMKKVALTLSLALAATLSISPSLAKDKRDGQDAVREQRERGQVMSLRQIEGRVVPQMQGMEYLGFDDYDQNEQIYRLRFIEGNRVKFVYVDAVTGRVVRVR